MGLVISVGRHVQPCPIRVGHQILLSQACPCFLDSQLGREIERDNNCSVTRFQSRQGNTSKKWHSCINLLTAKVNIQR
uniref:Uncharacterized protein n=1 Tax=Rhizophora mucronata TaxID=61149 RepID=A0A2P2IJC1_RHIMU